MIKFNIDFSHIHANDLQSFQYQSLFDIKPWSDLDLSVLDGMDLDIDLADRAKRLFDELIYQTLPQINVLDVLAMTSIDNPSWQSMQAKMVAKHWWISLFGGKMNAIMTCLNICIYHHHHHLGHVNIQKLNQALLDNHFDCHDKMLLVLAKCMLSNDHISLAKSLLLTIKSTPNQFFKKYYLAISDEFKHQVAKDWLTLYLQLSEKELPSYQKIVGDWLNEKSGISFAVQRAKLIFDDEYFDKDLQKLEKQTHKFSDIYAWLKSWSADLSFKERLGHEYLQILRVWIGAGNYYQLEKSVRYISYVHGEYQKERGKNISLNRYFFWTNYQQYIVDYWLLLPKYHAGDYDKIIHTENIKWSLGAGNIPIIILRLDKYYLIQPLVLKATECDLVMTDDLLYMDKLLNQQTIDIDEIKKATPCLIHDFYFGWQQEMYGFLKSFDIHAVSHSIKVAETHNKDFCIDGLSELPFDEKTKRKVMLRGWYQSANRHEVRQSQQVLRNVAKNLRIHGIV